MSTYWRDATSLRRGACLAVDRPEWRAPAGFRSRSEVLRGTTVAPKGGEK